MSTEFLTIVSIGVGLLDNLAYTFCIDFVAESVSFRALPYVAQAHFIRPIYESQKFCLNLAIVVVMFSWLLPFRFHLELNIEHNLKRVDAWFR